MNAIVMAGGYGTRLKPLTDNTPKPMLPVCNRPMIDYTISQLKYYGFEDIVFSLGFKPEQVVQHAIGYQGIKTHFSVEDMPLGTLGGVKAAAKYLSDVFVVTSGDGISNININALLNRHLSSKAEVTIAVKEVDNPSLYGVVFLGKHGEIEAFIEKPHDIKGRSYVNTGVYAVNKSALDRIKSTNCDFAKDLFPLLVSSGSIAYYIHDGYWRDVGDFLSYYNANFELLTSPFFPFVKNDFEIGSKLHGEKPASLISDTASTVGSVRGSIIGHGSRVASGSSLDKCIVLGDIIVRGMHQGCIVSDGICIDIKGDYSQHIPGISDYAGSSSSSKSRQ